MAVAVIVHKAAAGTPVLFLTPQSGLFGHIRKSAIDFITVENVLSKTCTENIVKSVVVIVAHANAARPTRRMQSRFLRNIGESAVSIVFVKTIGCASGRALKTGARQDENVYPTIIVIIDERTAATGRLNKISLLFRSAVDDRRTQPRIVRNIHKVRMKWTAGRRQSR